MLKALARACTTDPRGNGLHNFYPVAMQDLADNTTHMRDRKSEAFVVSNPIPNRTDPEQYPTRPSVDANDTIIQLHSHCRSTDHFFPAFFAAALAVVICFFHPKHWLQAMSSIVSQYPTMRREQMRLTSLRVLLTLVLVFLVLSDRRWRNRFAIIQVIQTRHKPSG